jgi:hypothetical protein
MISSPVVDEIIKFFHLRRSRTLLHILTLKSSSTVQGNGDSVSNP